MRTFTYEQLLHKQVPKPEDFTAVLNLIRDQITDGDSGRFFDWVILAGSVLRQTQTLASDLDLVVCLKDQPSIVEWLDCFDDLRHIRRFADERWVPLGLAITTSSELASHTHTLGPGFVGHLRWAIANGGLLWGEASNLSALPITPVEDARSYLAHKLQKCRRMLSAPASQVDTVTWMDWLAEILSTWRHAIRRFDEAHGRGWLEPTSPNRHAWGSTQTMLHKLDDTARLHLEKILQQAKHAKRVAWGNELHALSLHGETLHQLLVELHQQLPSGDEA